MLEYLKNQHKEPTEVETFLLSLIKVLLEEGWAITKEEFYIIMQAIDFDT
jgi:hypothetical protein